MDLLWCRANNIATILNHLTLLIYHSVRVRRINLFFFKFVCPMFSIVLYGSRNALAVCKASRSKSSDYTFRSLVIDIEGRCSILDPHVFVKNHRDKSRAPFSSYAVVGLEPRSTLLALQDLLGLIPHFA